MKWVKIPAENHPLFLAALPKGPGVETLKMFGGIAAKANGHMFAGLFGLSSMVMLSESHRASALKLDGASTFDPMGDGRMHSSDKVMLPETVMHDPAELRDWIAKAFAYARSLPPKAGKKAAKKVKRARK